MTDGSPDSSGAHPVRHEEMMLATARLSLVPLHVYRSKDRVLHVGRGGGFFVQADAAADLVGMGLESSVLSAWRLLVPVWCSWSSSNVGGWPTGLVGSRHPNVRPLEYLTYFAPEILRFLLDRCGHTMRHHAKSLSDVLTPDCLLSLPPDESAHHRTRQWHNGLVA